MTLHREHPWKGRTLIAALALVVLLVIARLALPYTIIYSATAWLANQGITSSIEDVSVKIIGGKFVLSNAIGKKDGEQVFTVREAAVFWQWRPFASKVFHIEKINLTGFSTDAQQYNDTIVIAGIVIPLADTAHTQPQAVDQSEDGISWGASLNEISFTDLKLCVKQYNAALAQAPTTPLIDYCGTMASLQLNGSFGAISTETAESSHAIQANGTILVEEVMLHNNILDSNLVTFSGIQLDGIVINTLKDINVDNLQVTDLAALQHSGHKKHQYLVEQKSLDISGLQITDLNRLTAASIKLDKPIVSLARDNHGKWKFERWLVNAGETTGPAGKSDTGNTATLALVVGDIRINNIEACYEEAGVMDYCTNLSLIDWNGNITIGGPTEKQPLSLELNGNLSLSNVIVTNNVLGKHLLDMASLAIADLDIKGINDAGFGRASLNKLQALQNTVDSKIYTLTLETIDIDNFRYSDNKLAINTLAVKQPGVALVKNKDGKFDFENWMIKRDTKPVAIAASTQDQHKLPGFKINRINLDTSLPIEFHDNSTTPPTHIGLGKLNIKLSELDSNRPDHKSPIELHAETTRHGTIDIKGVSQLFAAKPSFDATGKITGLDLRAFTPQTEKALGHIIKSGQLDADLTLLSVNGQLDSNISLKLHHFNLQATSKEDAAALDDMFGMPINKSLILLKDKKGTIKLEIPVTGDISKPEFDPTDAIVKATAKATTVTLVTFYTPYGLVYAGGNVLFDLATAVNFDPISFTHGSPDLDETNTAQLEQLTTLLKERPQVRLTLCGITGLNDLHALFPESKKLAADARLEPAQSARLEKLASERMANTKNYLVETAKIEHDRLILCTPEHRAETDAVSGVEISIK